MSSADDDEYLRDEWPTMPDGTEYDGKELLRLTRGGKSPFRELWDVDLLVQEVEMQLRTKVIDIITISSGSNNYVSIALS